MQFLRKEKRIPVKGETGETEDGKMKRELKLLSFSCLVVCISAISLAGVQYIDNLKLDIAEAKFYDHAADQFVLLTPMMSCLTPSKFNKRAC